MANEHAEPDKQAIRKSQAIQRATGERIRDQESTLAALALLLGPETDYQVRIQTTRQLMQQGTEILPLLLSTLNNYPEITTPPWPWWPPQYEHLSRLLLHISRSAPLSLRALLQHPAVVQPVGPVLWTSIIETAGLLSQIENESLLGEGLSTQWEMARYAAAMALANLAGKASLRAATLAMLRERLSGYEAISVRLAAAYALLRSGDDNGSGVETLIALLDPHTLEEARKAATFVLAAEPPISLPLEQRERLAQMLVLTLQDPNEEIAANAARALGVIALPSTLPTLCALLEEPHSHIQVAALAALEAVIGRKVIREVLQQHTLPAQIVPLLRSPAAEVRRQASYTLAAFGGDYAAAVLGTALLNKDHPGQLEAIEGVRLLYGALRTPIRTNVVRWLLTALHQSQEEIQIAALDSLNYLVWQARNHGRRKALMDISNEIVLDGILAELLGAPNSWLRQRSVELLGLLSDQPYELRPQLEHLLQEDSDTGVRTCVATALGQTAARWAIPVLLQALLDPDELVAEAALHALGRVASPDDHIVVYILRELSAYRQKEDEETTRLAHAARTLLKKWRRITGGGRQKFA
ncbi:MAG: HEAT repeat domain-containing protein [Chloroflexota bacterium]|nr:HEAT repeat domain-containing protein [Chloroflexota bacterium]